MFKTLLTPLRAKFNEYSNSPTAASGSGSGLGSGLLTDGGGEHYGGSGRDGARDGGRDGGRERDEEDLAPEDFARDVLIELMRNSIEKLKETEGMDERNEILSEIQRIMSLEARTKDVFRELDGFVILLGLLSTVLDVYHWERRRTSTQTRTRSSTSIPSIPLIIEPPSYPPPLLTTSLIFQITSLALTHHAQNMYYFHTHLGYDTLQSALEALVGDEETRVGTLWCLFWFGVGGWDD